jgi:voltage-gated potassium channel
MSDQGHLRKTLHSIIFGTDTPAGKLFDLWLIAAIVISVATVILDSIITLPDFYHRLFSMMEWLFTFIFTIEYLIRIYCCPYRWRYIKSFWGLVDLLAILPSYLALFFVGTSYLAILRLVRVLRIFRILRLFQYTTEIRTLTHSLAYSRKKMLIFCIALLILAVFFGALMYVIEGAESGFTSIPKSMYWAIVTLTTVGYGDISPQTPLGQALSSIIMLIGYSMIIIVPTTIIVGELGKDVEKQKKSIDCPECGKVGHDMDARFCRSCGTELPVF